MRLEASRNVLLVAQGEANKDAGICKIAASYSAVKKKGVSGGKSS